MYSSGCCNRRVWVIGWGCGVYGGGVGSVTEIGVVGEVTIDWLLGLKGKMECWIW